MEVDKGHPRRKHRAWTASLLFLVSALSAATHFLWPEKNNDLIVAGRRLMAILDPKTVEGKPSGPSGMLYTSKECPVLT